MLKVLIGAARRRGMTRHEMHKYAANTHAELVRAAPLASLIVSYTQTQVVDGARGSAVENEFDLVPELTFSDFTAFERVVGSPYFKETISPDEPKFGDLDSRRFLFVTEEVASPPIDDSPNVKAMFYLTATDSVDRFLERWRAVDDAILAAQKNRCVGLVRNLPLELEGLPSPFCAGVASLTTAPIGSRQLIRDYRDAWLATGCLSEPDFFHVEGHQLTVI